MDYYNRYLKYKIKYLKMKNMYGGFYNYKTYFILVNNRKEKKEITNKLKDLVKILNKVDIKDREGKLIISTEYLEDLEKVNYKFNITDKDYKDLVKKSKEEVIEFIKNHIEEDKIPKFPLKEGVDLRNIKLTKEGEYSYTKRKKGLKMLEFMREHIDNIENKMIMDGTSNVGSDSILFGLNMLGVIGVEINEENYNVLKHNVGLYNLDNIELVLGDVRDEYKNYEYDILYMDPPWGGIDYRKKEDIELYLGDSKLEDFIKEVIEYGVRYIVLKVPVNYNIDRLDGYNKVVRMISNYMGIIIKN